MNKRQKKKIEKQGIIKFKTLKESETCLIYFDAVKISPKAIHNFVEFWQKRGFNNFQIVPCNLSIIKEKIEVIEMLEKQIKKLKEDLDYQQVEY